MNTELPKETNLKEWTNMPPISEELYNELVKEFNNQRQYFFNDSYNLETKSMNKRANETKLNREQFEQLKERYVDTVVDSMSSKDLYEYVANDMYNFVDKLSEFEVYEEIKYTLDDEMLDEFVKQIKNDSKD